MQLKYYLDNLIFSYYCLGTTTKNVNELWGNIDGNLRSL